MMKVGFYAFAVDSVQVQESTDLRQLATTVSALCNTLPDIQSGVLPLSYYILLADNKVQSSWNLLPDLAFAVRRYGTAWHSFWN